MKLLIEIPEEKLNNFMYGDSLDDKDYDEIVDFMAQGTLIPDNATNDDFFKAVLDEKGYHAIHDRFIGTKWLFAPYKKGE